jgi:hypothetical protein
MADEVVQAKLVKLLRLLTSNHDGEVLAAAHKINGLLVAHDLDWEQLLSGASVELTRAQMERIYKAGYQKGLEDAARAQPPSKDDWAPAGTARTTEVGNQFDEVCAILDAAGRAGLQGRLSDFEKSFSISMAERLSDWGQRAFISEKQWAVLGRLRSRLEREGFL